MHGKNSKLIKCMFWFSLQFCLKYFFLYEEMSEICPKIYISLHAKSPLFLSDFHKTGISSTDFRKKKPQISNFIKILPVGAELFHADRQT
jgi:hypothetical protein